MSALIRPTGKLAEITAERRRDAAALEAAVPLADLEARARAYTPRGFAAALTRPAGGLPRVIAECKRKAPSAGALKSGASAAGIARAYAEAGAACLSILTEPRHFDGCLDDLIAARAAVDIPLLRKDFTVSRHQIAEARAAGADCVLLIVAALGEETAALHDYATGLGLDVLIETHDARELDLAIAIGAPLIGINNRNLGDLSIDLAVTEALAPRLPDDRILVAESGIASPADLLRMAAVGADAVLIGSALMRGGDPGAALRDLLAGAAL